MSDTAPVDYENTKSGINRRIELYILTANTLAQLNKVYKSFEIGSGGSGNGSSPLAQHELDKVLPDSKRKAVRQAELNQPVTSFEVLSRYDWITQRHV